MDCEQGELEGGTAPRPLGPRRVPDSRRIHSRPWLHVLDRLPSLEHICIGAVSADPHAHWGAIAGLIERRYRWRGYRMTRPVIDPACPYRVTLTASSGHEPVGTITVGMDGPMPLDAEQTFPAEVEHLREQGRALCEFVKLAIDPSEDSKAILAGLFHVAYIVAFRIHNADTVVFEVNPRHASFYCRLLGSTVLASGKHNANVNAPSVLLGLELQHVEHMIATLGGRPMRAVTERTLYPNAFAPRDEDEIVRRLRRQALRTGHVVETLPARERDRLHAHVTDPRARRASNSG